MRSFLLIFSLLGPLLFVLIYFPSSPLYDLNAWQTSMTNESLKKLLDLTGLSTDWTGNRVSFKSGAYLTLTDACNGMAAFLLFAAALFSFPAKISEKVSWLLTGYFAIFFANLLRLVGISVAMDYDANAYGWAHDLAGRYGFILFLLLLYGLFTYSIKSERRLLSLRSALSTLLALLFLSLSPLSAADSAKKMSASDRCRYIIKFKPGIDRESAYEVLKKFPFDNLHIYENLSEAKGALILFAETDRCTEEMEKSVAKEPSIESLQQDKTNRVYPEKRDEKKSEASTLPLLF